MTGTLAALTTTATTTSAALKTDTGAMVRKGVVTWEMTQVTAVVDATSAHVNVATNVSHFQQDS